MTSENRSVMATDLIDTMLDLCRAYEIDDAYKIRDSLKTLYGDEPLMYWKIKRYRDHLFHTCRVALLGLDFLNTEYPAFAVGDRPARRLSSIMRAFSGSRERPLWKAIYELLPDPLVTSVTDEEHVRSLQDSLSNAAGFSRLLDANQCFMIQKPVFHTDREIERFVKRIWLIAALKHDIGYCLTYLTALVNRSGLLEMTDCNSIYFAQKKLRGAFADIFRRLRAHATNLESPMREVHSLKIPHGIVGALHVKALKGDEYVMEIAARAIARHDDDSREVGFAEEPLSWLLLLCDELQEWGRPVKVFEERGEIHSGSANLSLIARSELDWLDIERPTAENRYTTSVLFDYHDNRFVLEFETGFSFPGFVYTKQRNLCRLRGGPRFDLEYVSNREHDMSFEDTLIGRQFRELSGWARTKHLFTLAKWCEDTGQVEGYCHKMSVGGNKVISRPPDIDSQIGTFLAQNGSGGSGIGEPPTPESA